MSRSLNRREVVKMIGMASLGGSLLESVGEAGAGRKDRLLYVGTYTSQGSKGVYLFRLNNSTGELTAVGLAAEAVNPSYLAIAADGRHLYSVNEINDFKGEDGQTGGGAVTAFAIDPKTGLLRTLNQQGTKGGSPCYVSIYPEGKSILAANYGGGNVAVLPIHADGSIGPATDLVQHTGKGGNPQRQQGPRAHCAVIAPDRRHILVVDLGIDKVMIYRWDSAGGKLVANDPPFFSTSPGAGPRHIDFHSPGSPGAPGARGSFAYLINELGSSLTVCSYDGKRGELKEIETVSTLPAEFKGNNTCADVHVHPSGKFLYGSNRGHDSIVAWRIGQSGNKSSKSSKSNKAANTAGRLEYIGHESTQGRNPRNFVIDPTGTFLLAANQSSDSIVVFRIDRESGRLTPTGHKATLSMPVCLKFL